MFSCHKELLICYSHFPVSLIDWFQDPLHIPNSWPSVSAGSAFTAYAWICGCRIHRCREPVILRNLCKNKMLRVVSDNTRLQKLKSLKYGLTIPSNEGRMFSFDGTIMVPWLHNILIHPHLSKPWKPCDLCILRNITFAAEQKGGRKESIARADTGLGHLRDLQPSQCQQWLGEPNLTELPQSLYKLFYLFWVLKFKRRQQLRDPSCSQWSLNRFLLKEILTIFSLVIDISRIKTFVISSSLLKFWLVLNSFCKLFFEGLRREWKASLKSIVKMNSCHKLHSELLKS